MISSTCKTINKLHSYSKGVKLLHGYLTPSNIKLTIPTQILIVGVRKGENCGKLDHSLKVIINDTRVIIHESTIRYVYGTHFNGINCYKVATDKIQHGMDTPTSLMELTLQTYFTFQYQIIE